MPLSSRSHHERRRLAALHALKILATPPEERFDRITRLAARLFNVPIALVSLVDNHQRWFTAYGLTLPETRRDFCLCARSVEDEKAVVIPDTLDDPRFAINPLVVGDPHVRFYAGQPLVAPNGSRLGTLCLLDTVPRELDRTAFASLRDLAVLVEEELYQRELAETSVHLYESEVRYRSLFEQALDGIMLVERGTGRVLLANRALQRMLGYTASEMTDLTLYDFIVHEPTEVAANLERCFTQDKAPRGERGYRRKDGKLVTVEISTSILRYYGHRAVCVIVRDRSERKAAWDVLAKAESLFGTLFGNSLGSVLILGADERVKAANPAACRLLGHAADELTKLSLSDVFDINDHNTSDTLARALDRGPMHGEIVGVRRSGERFPAEASLVPVVDNNGERNLSVSLRDISRSPTPKTDKPKRRHWMRPPRLPITGLP